MPSKDEYFMSLALQEAKKGLGFTSPNPLVGAVIVKNNAVIAKGYHKKDGQAHAEINTIKKVKKADLKGSTLYINLEPCAHYGRTPPCAISIAETGIKKVIISAIDPDKRVNGKGINILKKSGIKVVLGILEKEAKNLNSIYFFYKKNFRPYIVLKSALTLDGRIATYTYNSKWISNEKCKSIAHKLRLRLKAVAIGGNTILKDQPKLNCRIKKYIEKPVDKLVFSSSKIDLNCLAPNDGKIYYIDRNITSSPDKFISFCREKMIDSVLVEGGKEVYSWFLKNNLVDRIFLFYKPAFMGNDGIPVFLNTGIKYIDELKDFKVIDAQVIDNNIMAELAKGEPICLLV